MLSVRMFLVCIAAVVASSESFHHHDRSVHDRFKPNGVRNGNSNIGCINCGSNNGNNNNRDRFSNDRHDRSSKDRDDRFLNEPVDSSEPVDRPRFRPATTTSRPVETRRFTESDMRGPTHSTSSKVHVSSRSDRDDNPANRDPEGYVGRETARRFSKEMDNYLDEVVDGGKTDTRNSGGSGNGNGNGNGYIGDGNGNGQGNGQGNGHSGDGMRNGAHNNVNTRQTSTPTFRPRKVTTERPTTRRQWQETTTRRVNSFGSQGRDDHDNDDMKPATFRPRIVTTTFRSTTRRQRHGNGNGNGYIGDGNGNGQGNGHSGDGMRNGAHNNVNTRQTSRTTFRPRIETTTERPTTKRFQARETRERSSSGQRRNCNNRSNGKHNFGFNNGKDTCGENNGSFNEGDNNGNNNGRPVVSDRFEPTTRRTTTRQPFRRQPPTARPAPVVKNKIIGMCSTGGQRNIYEVLKGTNCAFLMTTGGKTVRTECLAGERFSLSRCRCMQDYKVDSYNCRS